MGLPKNVRKTLYRLQNGTAVLFADHAEFPRALEFLGRLGVYVSADQPRAALKLREAGMVIAASEVEKMNASEFADFIAFRVA